MEKTETKKQGTGKENLDVPKEEVGKEKNKKTTLKEYEKRILELADKGLTSEKIGETLRQEGIHPKEFSKKISKILKENSKYINPDLKNTEKKLERIKKHYEKNKQDKRSKREKDRIFSRMRKLKKHFKE